MPRRRSRRRSPRLSGGAEGREPRQVHKSDLGLVRLNLRDADAVRAAFAAVSAALDGIGGAEGLRGAGDGARRGGGLPRRDA